MLPPALIVIGASHGGLNALRVLLGALPADFPGAVAIVQHRGSTQESLLSALLARHCRLPLAEPLDKEPILAGRVYLAPGNYHLLVEGDADGVHFAFSLEERVSYSRPSIDLLFETAADALGGRVIGVLLTGASADGARGLARIKALGGRAIVQDPASAECAIMPQAALAATSVDAVLAIEEIGAFLAKWAQVPDIA